MAIGWFICPYKRRLGERNPTRYCAMDDFTLVLRAEGGDWSETEVLGDAALVKVRASETTLAIIAGTAGFHRLLNKVLLSESLSDLTALQLNFVNTRLLALGYSQAEIDAASGGDWRTKMLKDLLQMIAKRRLRPRYDADNDLIVLDGPEQPVRPLKDVDEAVA
jgi:hypothetical protein